MSNSPTTSANAGPAVPGGASPIAAINPQGSPHNTSIDPAQDLNSGPSESADEFAGLGPWMEDDDATVFRRANELVLRQEIIAQSRLAQDIYFTYVKLGYPFATLQKDPNKSIYTCTLPGGTKPLSIQAVPNQAWDLVNKATEAILADPAQPDPAPLNDSEDAQGAATMAERFLTEDSGESGTNDLQLMYNAVDGALACATKYLEGWTDPVGGGYVPLQIMAHPEAVSPDNPLIGPEGMPTPNNVMRYVTAPQGGQFSTDPAQAAPQWQPKIRGTVWGREHWRIYPESQTVETAHMAIGLLYCTVGEAKRRWPVVAGMGPDEINALLDWTPIRYLVLLPPFQRARWRTSSASDKDKSGTSDERLLFYYRVMVKADPDHKRGADVIVSGAQAGIVLDRKPLGMDVDVPGEDGQTTKEPRCMDLPLVQVTPRADPDERDPTGRAYMQLFSGATEFDAALRAGFLEALDIWLHPDSYLVSTSTVQGYQVQESRVSGDAIPVLRETDKPTYGNQPPLPPNFWNAAEENQKMIRSIASLDKAVTGETDPTKESGKALQLAIGRAMVGLARMNYPVNAATERWWRIKLQLAMRDYQTPQLVRYVGEDGSPQVQEFRATDFALVGNVGVQAGTGTMMPAEQKVQYLANLSQTGFIPREDAADAARQTFTQRLGLADNPHEQYVERCVALWLKGPPKVQQAQQQPGQPPQPEWVQQWQQYRQLKPLYDAAVQQQQAQAAMPVPGQAPTAPPQPPPKPWTPFPDRANDTEPIIAGFWMRKLSKVMSTAKYASFPIEWQQCLDEKYLAARQVVAQATAPAPALPKGVMVQAKPGDAASLAADVQAAETGKAPTTQPSQQSQPQPGQ